MQEEKDHSDIHEKFGSEKTESTNIDNSQGHKQHDMQIFDKN